MSNYLMQDSDVLLLSQSRLKQIFIIKCKLYLIHTLTFIMHYIAECSIYSISVCEKNVPTKKIHKEKHLSLTAFRHLRQLGDASMCQILLNGFIVREYINT